MRTPWIIVVCLVAIVQWGAVCALAGLADNGFSNVTYFVSFGVFWAGLAMLLSQLAWRMFAARSR